VALDEAMLVAAGLLALEVGSSTHTGSWPVTVNCGKSGKLALRLRVVRTGPERRLPRGLAPS